MKKFNMFRALRKYWCKHKYELVESIDLQCVKCSKIKPLDYEWKIMHKCMIEIYHLTGARAACLVERRLQDGLHLEDPHRTAWWLSTNPISKYQHYPEDEWPAQHELLWQAEIRENGRNYYQLEDAFYKEQDE